jgi:TfoX/Sxy family transcriptional regulator of competence genes
MAWRKSPPALVDLFDAVLPADPRIERRKMFGYPAAFVAGRLFSGLHQESFILKLPEPDRETLRAEHGAQAFEPRPGRRMREYVVLPAALLADRAALGSWLARSIEYTAAQGPKKTMPRRRRRSL